MRLTGAVIGGVLDLDCAVIINNTGPALQADGIRTEQDVWLRGATANAPVTQRLPAPKYR